MRAFERLLTKSPGLEMVIRSAQIVAATDAPTLILGESGTGKELLAQALHEGSPRADRPFVPLNCAAMPEDLVESTLFGHRKGAFTGATETQQGHVRAAEGGTLFLDEVGELPLAAQAKLLRFLESGEIQPVGESRLQKVDVRIIAATNRDLYQLVRQGGFREDLYYRLQVVPLELPPLRERSGDILLLLNHYLEHFSLQHQLPAPSFGREALEFLKRHRWQGNVRELRNLCERMVVLAHGQVIEKNMLPPEMLGPGAADGRTADDRDAFVLPDAGVKLEEVELSLIQQALEKSSGNKSKAARLLGITRDTLLYRLKKYALW